MAAKPSMPEGGFAKDRSALAGLGEAILDVLSNRTTDAEWGAWLQPPYERAAAAGDMPLSVALLKAGARGNHLHPAVRGGHHDLVEELLRLGASPTAKDEHGDTPIHIAASLGRGDIMEKLLEIEEVDGFEVDAKGRTAAHLACWNGDVPTVKAVLHGIDMDRGSGSRHRHRLGKTKVGFTPYDFAVRANHIPVKKLLRKGVGRRERANCLTDGAVLHRAAEEDNVPMIDFLVGEAGTDADFRDDRGHTPLHSAAIIGSSHAVVALVKHGADASALDEEGRMPLHHAAYGDHTTAIDVLCTAAGADINLRVKHRFSYPPECDTWSALDFAAIEGSVDAFKALVRHRADWKALSGDGLTVLNTAAASNQTELIDVLIELGAPVDGPGKYTSSPLYTATRAYSPDAVRALIRHGANVQKREPERPSVFDEESPLAEALIWSFCGSDVVKLLIENGADPNDMPCYQSSALQEMFNIPNEDVLEALLRGGAEVSEPNDDGDYLLHQAVEKFHGSKAIELLVEAGAEVNAASSRGLTPLQMACSKPDGSAVAALLRHGADIDVVDSAGNSPLHLAAVAEGSKRDMCRFSEKVPLPSSVDVLLRTGADETATNDHGHTPLDHVRLELADRGACYKNIKKVLKLLARAPEDRAWRRRAFWVLCRAYPERVRVGREASRAKMPRIDKGGTAGSEDNGDEAGGSTDGEGAGCFSRVSARLLGLHEEGVFRTVIGFL